MSLEQDLVAVAQAEVGVEEAVVVDQGRISVGV